MISPQLKYLICIRFDPSSSINHKESKNNNLIPDLTPILLWRFKKKKVFINCIESIKHFFLLSKHFHVCINSFIKRRVKLQLVSSEHLQKFGGKNFMTLLCEVYAVIGQRNVPSSGIGKADTQLLRQGLTEPGEGTGLVNELRAGYPCSQGHRRRRNQQDLVSV